MINKTPPTATMGVKPFALIGAFVRAVQNLLRPARSSMQVGIGAAQDLTRTRSNLLTENASLRQQVIVLSHRGIRRPRVHRDDDKFGERFATVAEGAEIEVLKIPPRSSNLNPICERFLGSVRRECLDHVVILTERRLRRVLKECVEIYFYRARPHQGLSQEIPVADSRLVCLVGVKIVPIPVLGGLHHDYQSPAWATRKPRR